MIADLDTLLTALYVELTDRIIPARGFARRGPGRPPEATDAELACLAVAQVLLRYDDERRWLRAAPGLIGHLFPPAAAPKRVQRPAQGAGPADGGRPALAGRCDARDRGAAAADGRHPGPCGTSAVTAKRSGLFGYAGYGYCPSHSRWYWGCKLLLICTCDGTVTGFSLANPKLHGERDQARQTLERQPANRPAPGTAVVTGKGLSAAGPNQVYSWDINKLHGPAKWTYCHLYVILDIYSRYAVGWMVATRESASLAEKLISETCAKQGINPGQLSLHADRGSSMTSKPVALLPADLGITQSRSRPHVSNDNPYSEAQFKTLKYRPAFPAQFASVEATPGPLPGLFPLEQQRAPPRRARPAHRR